MATKNYMINDKWLDLDKQNIVELQSVDGVLDSLKVNGSEIVTPSGKITITENGTDIDIAQYALADVNVEGGGGSSDFSTAQVSVTYNSPDDDIYAKVPCVEDNTIISGTFINKGTTKVLTVPIASGGAIIDFDELSEQSYVISGDIESVDTPNLSPFLITGDCVITIS